MKPKIYIIAGEPSGDLLAAGLMRAVFRQTPDAQFVGVGGAAMMDADKNFRSLFDIDEISVMGIFEVLPRLRNILRRIRQTVSDIELSRPDILVTVDSWGFVASVLSKLKKRGSQVPVIHYVAPQVWAWKKGRAKKVAQLVDRLMTLLPNEGQYFEKYGLRCDFVGHPVVERTSEMSFDGEKFREKHRIPATAKVVTVLPGSRRSEIKRLGPILNRATEIIKQTHKDLFFITISASDTIEDRYNAFAVSTIALSKSGTVSLELAAVGVPHLIMYKFNALSNLAAKLLVKIRFANLINLLADREIIPEFVLDNCRANLIADCALKLLAEPEKAAAQVVEAREVMQKLRLPDIMPSDRAAQIVLEVAVACRASANK